MKILKYSLFIGILILFAKCSPDNDGTFGETIDREVQLIGNWKIESVSQIDLDAEKKSFPSFATKVDITNAILGMPYSDFSMDLQNGSITTSIASSPMSFIINEGSGTWSWISDSEIELVKQELGINASSGITTSIGGQDVNLYISSYTGINSQPATLSLSYDRMDVNDSPVTRYEYVFVKQ